MRFLGIIPARGGSKRVPRKNLQLVGGISLVERAFVTAAPSNLDEIVVSTDDPDIARAFSGFVQARKCGPDGPMIDVVHDVLSTRAADAVCILQPTSPFRTTAMINRCLEIFATIECESLVSVDSSGSRDGQIYLVRGRAMSDGPLYSAASYAVVAENQHESIDINTPEELAVAQRIADERGI